MLKLVIEKKYYRKNKVLESIDFEISSNGIYGVIGKNGAGKTTLFQCIASQTPYSGYIHLNDKPIDKDAVGWCPTNPFVYDYLTSEEFKSFFAKLYGLKKVNNDLFDLPKNQLIKEFSTGMKKKAYLNALLQKKYSIYLFDEVFNGLDIESVFTFEKIIRKLGESNIVFVSSHILPPLFKICKNIFLIEDSKIKKFKKNEFDQIESFFDKY